MGVVVVLGSIITDLVARASHLPRPGESLIGEGFDRFLGGKGINQAIAAARQGAQVSLVGRVGTDSFGDAFFTQLAEESVDSSYVERDEENGTGVSLVIIASDTGQNIIVATPLANLAVPATSVEGALHAASQQTGPGERPIFLTQCETSRVSFMVGLELARSLGMHTILNAAPIPREMPGDELFSNVDILIVNEVEAAYFGNVVSVGSIQAAHKAAENLLARGLEHVIVTLGSQGALWSHFTGEGSGTVSHHFIPPIPVKAVDTIAAGDAFCGSLAASLSSGMPMEAALRRASATGALAATKHGAIPSLPTAEQVDKLLSQGQ